MKRIVVIAIMLMGIAPILRAQEEEDWSFPVTYSGQRPVITDFVNAILSQEDIGESLGGMKNDWNIYLAGKPLPEGSSFTVDVKNGYMRYDSYYKEDDGTVYTHFIEFCYWNCSDGRHKLVGENTVSFRDGQPFMGQFSGTSFYMYDGKTGRMDFTSAYDLGFDIDYPEDTQVYVQQLPRVGKTIETRIYTSSGEILVKATWNGSKFVLE